MFNKKTLRELLLYILTIGAGLLIGFLSFTGMLAITPVLSLAFLSFGLSIAYEGQIFYQNIDGALKKLFKSRYFEQQLAKKFLLAQFPKEEDLEKSPQFLKDYAAQLKLLDQYPNTDDYKKQRLNIEKNLRAMEKWFAKQLFQSTSIDKKSKYVQSLQKWLHDKNHQNITASFQEQLISHKSYYGYARLLSLISGLFMTLGTTYLLMESFMAIPLLTAYTAWFPVLIVPLSIIAGVAYEPARDTHLVSLPAGHLFGTQTTRIAIKAGVFLRDYVYT